MPKPIYIICSESGSEDRTTGLFSHFKVLEQIELKTARQQQGKPMAVMAFPMQMVAVWGKSESDRSEQAFEYHVSFFLPPDGEENEVSSGVFCFEDGKERYRFAVNVQAPLFRAPGVFRAECRVRKVGDTDWILQSYELPVIAVEEQTE